MHDNICEAQPFNREIIDQSIMEDRKDAFKDYFNCFIEDDFIYLRKYISQIGCTFAALTNRTHYASQQKRSYTIPDS